MTVTDAQSDQHSTPDRDAGEDFRRTRAGAILLVLALSLALILSGAFEPLEHRLTVLRANLLDRQPTGQVAIIEIDAKSLKELDTWPWSRSLHARVLNRLRSDGASIVAFDIDFSSASDQAGDRAFAAALEQSPATVLPVFQQRASDDPQERAVVRSQPAPLFRSAWVGGVNIFPASDGVVRDYPAATIIGGQVRPSMAALLAENDNLADRAFQPDWAIDAGAIPRHSFVDVVKGRTPAGALSGKRILVGATAIELGDRYTVPRFRTVPGVVIQALAAESLLQDRAMLRSGMVPTVAGLCLVALLFGVPRFRRFRRTLPLTGVMTVALIAVTPLAVQSRWPLSVDSAGLLFCALGCIGVRVFLEVRRRMVLNVLLDPETGLGNSRSLAAILAKKPSLTLAAGAIDRFESIRDAIGSAAFAELLREAASRIATATGASVYRIAPDTLAWTQPSDDNFENIPRLFREPVHTAAGPVDVHLTIGLDWQPIDGPATARIERAVAAVASARAAGKACHRYSGANPAAQRELSLMSELRRGLTNGEVEVVYQPKLDLRLGSISHAEALVRWNHPTDGLIPPDRFIPLAESTGVIRELTQFVLNRAAADLVKMSQGGCDLCVAVNVSAADLDSSEIVHSVKDVLLTSGLDPRRLAVEVTESAIIGSPDQAAISLHALRECGIQLSIDDYGTGQSTLSYLKDLPFDELKIDRSFVTDICRSKNDRIMVRSTIDLAHELGLRVVAEGVEDQATLRLLHSMGCDFAQGYFVGRPMPADALRQAQCRAAQSRMVA